MFRFWRQVCLVGLVLAGGLFAISKLSTVPEKVTAVPGANEFALDLYRQIAADHEGENIFISPFSIRCALAMAWEGARGETAEQMAVALKLPEVEGAEVHGGFGSLTRALNAKDKPYEFNVANALWIDRTLPLVEAYVQQITSAYGAGIRQVDFISNHELARAKINQWVEDKTHEKIQGLMPKGTLTKETRMVLANGVYFRGQWATQFGPALTREGLFTLADGTEVQVPMMQRNHAKMGIHHVEGFSAMELPYVGDDLSMVVLLPSEDSDIHTLESKLTPDIIAAAVSQLHELKVDELRMPRFKISPTLSYTLKGSLQAMGMELAFTNQADFTGINSREARLFITDMMHKGFIDVNEQGTEAAAAAVGRQMKGRSMVLIDRPFLFMIRYRPTGEILFFGRVLDPREK